MQLNELDWAASPWELKIGRHWRFFVCQLVASIPTAMLWNSYSPHTFWFEKLWLGLATGSLIGSIPGVCWQIRKPERRPNTSGRLLAFSGLANSAFTGVAVFLGAPDLESQEHERTAIRSLDGSDISELFVRIEGQPQRRVSDVASIASLSALTRHAELLYPSHEGSSLEFQLRIHCKNGAVIEYHGRVPEHHPNDISLEFKGYFTWSELIIRGGRWWLDAVERARHNKPRDRTPSIRKLI